MISLSQARSHLHIAGRRADRRPLADAFSERSPLDAVDVAHLALLLTRSSESVHPPRSSYLDAYYGSEQATDRL